MEHGQGRRLVLEEKLTIVKVGVSTAPQILHSGSELKARSGLSSGAKVAPLPESLGASGVSKESLALVGRVPKVAESPPVLVAVLPPDLDDAPGLHYQPAAEEPPNDDLLKPDDAYRDEEEDEDEVDDAEEEVEDAEGEAERPQARLAIISRLNRRSQALEPEEEAEEKELDHTQEQEEPGFKNEEKLLELDDMEETENVNLQAHNDNQIHGTELEEQEPKTGQLEEEPRSEVVEVPYEENEIEFRRDPEQETEDLEEPRPPSFRPKTAAAKKAVDWSESDGSETESESPAPLEETSKPIPSILLTDIDNDL